jgi:hypothetical protein
MKFALTSPFGKGGLRGIFMRGGDRNPVMIVYEAILILLRHIIDYDQINNLIRYKAI